VNSNISLVLTPSVVMVPSGSGILNKAATSEDLPDPVFPTI